MRTGVLSDTNAKMFEPLPFIANERHFGQPHVHKTTKRTRKRKQGYANTHRPRTPYIAHHELAQLIDPLNPRKHLDVFEQHMEMALFPKPPKSFDTYVSQFREMHPRFNELRDEAAFMMQKLNLDPNDKKYGLTDGRGVRLKYMRDTDFPAHILLEKLLADPNLTNDEADLFKVTYDEAVGHFTSAAVVHNTGVDSGDDRDRSPPGNRRSHAPFLPERDLSFYRFEKSSRSKERGSKSTERDPVEI